MNIKQLNEMLTNLLEDADNDSLTMKYLRNVYQAVKKRSVSTIRGIRQRLSDNDLQWL